RMLLPAPVSPVRTLSPGPSASSSSSMIARSRIFRQRSMTAGEGSAGLGTAQENRDHLVSSHAGGALRDARHRGRPAGMWLAERAGRGGALDAMRQMLVAALVRGAPICAARAPREKPAPRRFPSALSRARSRWVALIFAVGLLLGGGPWRWGSLAAAHARALGADADQGSSLVTSRQTTPESSSPIGQAPEARGPAPGASALAPADSGAAAAAPLAERSRVTLHFFWAVGCPHCEQAKPFLERLRRQRPGLVVEAIEVRQDPAGRARFFEVVRRLGIATFGVPLFVVGERYVTGFVPGETEPQV